LITEKVKTNEELNTNNKNGEPVDDQDKEDSDDEECPQLVNMETIPFKPSLLAGNSFDDLKDKISEYTLKAIKDMQFSQMTEIQSKTIPHLLEGK